MLAERWGHLMNVEGPWILWAMKAPLFLLHRAGSRSFLRMATIWQDYKGFLPKSSLELLDSHSSSSESYRLKINKKGTLSIFKSTDYPFSDEYFLDFVSAFGFDFGDELFLCLDDFSIFPISHEFKMELTFGGCDFDLNFADLIEFFRLFCLAYAFIPDLSFFSQDQDSNPRPQSLGLA